MDPLIVMRQMIVILILIMTGYILKKMNKVSPETKKFISFFVVNVTNACTLISSVLASGSERDMNAIWIMTAVAIGMFAFFILVGNLAALLTGNPDTKVSLILMFTFSNLGFIGLPVIKAVLGDAYVVHNALFNLVYNVVFYTYAVQLVPENEGEKFSFKSLKSIISPGTIGAIVAITIFALNVQLPFIASEAIKYTGGLTVPLALFTIGVTLAEQESLFVIFTDLKVYLFSVVKMILLPFVFILFFRYVAAIPDDLRFVAILMVAMPVGNLPMMILNERGRDATFVSNAIIVTTILSVVTLPFMAFVDNLFYM